MKAFSNKLFTRRNLKITIINLMMTKLKELKDSTYTHLQFMTLFSSENEYNNLK